MLEFYLKLKNELGQDASEYALVIGLVSLVALAGALLLGQGLATWYTNLTTFVTGMASNIPGVS